MIDVHRIKNTLFCILLPVGISSIILDYSRWVLEVPKGIAKIYSLIILLGIIIFVIKKNTYEKIKRYGLKIFFSFIISYLIMGIIEIVYTSILLIIIKIRV
jgi:hypothetical protein